MANNIIESHNHQGCGFLPILIQHAKQYPLLAAEDIIKLIYQSEFGAEHLVADEAASLRYLQQELASWAKKESCHPVVEDIGSGVSRVYLHTVSELGLSLATLNRIFLLTANRSRGSNEGFKAKTAIAELLASGGDLPVDIDTLRQRFVEHAQSGYPAVHHSVKYRSAYSPSYRVVDKKYSDLLPVLCSVDSLLQESRKTILIAIEGASASGKSSLASLLGEVYSCNVFHCDDFFLRPEQRTEERYKEPGGNIDYERMSEELIAPLLTGLPFAFHPFDCQKMALAPAVEVEPERMSIIEGAYCMHPKMAVPYNLRIFLQISPTEQKKRLERRNPGMLQQFLTEWIPLEERYFKHFAIEQSCDLVLCLSRHC